MKPSYVRKPGMGRIALAGIRPTGYGLAFAAAGAVLWTGSPRCEGHFCLGLDDLPDAGRAEAAARDQVKVVDPARLWGASPPGRQTEEAVEADPLGATPEAAAPARVVVGAVKETPQAAGPTGLAQAVSPEAPAGGLAEAVGPELPQGWAEVAQAAVAEPDAELRGEAIRSVSVYRGTEAVAVLTEVAAGDPAPDNRIQALESLWYAAADGLDQEGEIKRVLEDARADPDPDIAELAQKAVADIERLAARRANGG